MTESAQRPIGFAAVLFALALAVPLEIVGQTFLVPLGLVPILAAAVWVGVETAKIRAWHDGRTWWGIGFVTVAGAGAALYCRAVYGALFGLAS